MRAKKLLAALLGAVMIATTFPITALADTPEDKTDPGFVDQNNGHPKRVYESFDFVVDDIAYSIVDGGVEVSPWYWVWQPHTCDQGHTETVFCGSEYTGGTITIPATVEYNDETYNVVGIGDNAFANASNYTVTFPISENFTYIGEGVFRNTNPNMTSVTIPASVTHIGAYSFALNTDPIAGEESIDVVIPENSKLQVIGDYAFANNSAVKELNFPDTLTTIGQYAFSKCTSLTSVTIPASVTNLETATFDNYYNAGANEGAGNVSFENGSMFKIQDGVFYDDENLIRVLDWQENVVVPDGIKYIGADAFNAYSTKTPNEMNTLKTIELPESLVSIGKTAFRSCKALESVTIPENVTEIGTAVFNGCSGLKKVVIEGPVTVLEQTFNGCSSLETVVLPDTVEVIGDNTFNGCKKLDLEKLPSNLKELGNSAFNECESLKKVVIPSGVTEIPEMAFAGCIGLEQIVLPEGITSIGNYAFDLTKDIGGGNYSNENPQLSAINIPSTVTSLGTNFLGGVQETTALIFEGEQPPTFGNGDALDGISGEGKNKPVIYFPANAADAYTETGSALVNAGLVTAPQEGETPSNSYSLEVTAPTTTLYSGDQLALDVISTIPSGGELRAESSNPSVAEVTVQDGKVTVKSLSKGSATITLSICDSNGILLTSKSVDLTFSEPPYTGKYSYEISMAQPDNGRVDVDKYATEGETVTITVTPDAGYMLDTLSVTAGGKELDVTDNGDGTYSFTMPSSKVNITAAFTEQLEEPNTDVADIFSDVTPDAWYTDAVQYAYDNGLMTGTSATTFEPNTTTTRGMIVSMLHRLEGSPAVGSADFSDVAGGDWYADPVAWAASEGIVGGYGDGTFGPNDPITREQMASILYRYADYKGLDVSARASLDAYSDADSVSPWASDVMSWAVSEGIISGMSEDTLAPQGTATRAQVAAMFQRFLENVIA